MNDKVHGFRHEGDVTMDGQSIWGGAGDLLTLRRRVGMLFQRPNPFPMSIKDNVVAGVKAHRIAKGKQLDVVAEQRLREVGLWDAVKDRLGDSPFRLSGGQQQLLCLARALAVGPEVLFLDEPTSALDPISTEYVEALIKQLAPALTLDRGDAQLGSGPTGGRFDHVLLPGPAHRTRADRADLREPSRGSHRALRQRPDRLIPPASSPHQISGATFFTSNKQTIRGGTFCVSETPSNANSPDCLRGRDHHTQPDFGHLGSQRRRQGKD